MKKRNVFLAASLFIFLAIAIGGWSYFQKPSIERIDDPGKTPIYTCPGAPKGSKVGYIDRRIPDQTRYYYDGNAHGLLTAFQANDDESIRIEEVEVANAWDSQSRKYPDYWISRDSDKARELQKKYDEVRTAYLKLHPGASLPENKPPVPEPIRAEKVKFFYDWLAAYEKEESKPLPRSYVAKETVWFRTYLAFREMRSAYFSLNESEKNSIYGKSNLPKGIKVDQSAPLTEVAGINLTTGDSRKDFEAFLTGSYVEIDYMSAWSISRDSKTITKITDAYYGEVEARGLKVARD